MNKAELTRLEEALRFPFSSARIKHAGFDVTFTVIEEKRLKWVIQVYINGWFKGLWCNGKEPCPEQLYLRRIERPLHKPSDLQGLKRALGAKSFAEARAKRFVYFRGHWPSAKALCRHLAVKCPDAELVEPREPAPEPAPGAALAEHFGETRTAGSPA